jgi:hypothetical protein
MVNGERWYYNLEVFTSLFLEFLKIEKLVYNQGRDSYINWKQLIYENSVLFVLTPTYWNIFQIEEVLRRSDFNLDRFHAL